MRLGKVKEVGSFEKNKRIPQESKTRPADEPNMGVHKLSYGRLETGY